MSSPLRHPARKTADKCTVYWDYENMPIPKQSSLTEILSTLKDKLWKFIGYELPIEYKVYIRATKITAAIHNDFDMNAVTLIHVPSSKPEAVDKRLMIDMLFTLYELERDNKSRAIALISGDKDFGNLLSKIHHTPPISKSFLILLRNTHIDSNLSHVVDHVIQLDYGAIASGNRSRSQSRSKTKSKSKSKSKSKRITIHIMHLLDRNNKFEHTTKSTASLNAIKDIVCKTNKIAKRSQLVFFCNAKDGKQKLLLNHNDPLDRCGIGDGQKIIWYCDKNNQIAPSVKKTNKTPPKRKKKRKPITPPKKKRLRLTFQQLDTNDAFSITTKRSNLIKNLRLTCFRNNQKLNIPQEKFVLYHGGTELRDPHTIASYNIKDGDVLIWYAESEDSAAHEMLYKQKIMEMYEQKKLKSKIVLTFEHQQKEFKTIEFNSTLVNSVHNVKQNIVRKFKLKVDEKDVNLVFKGKVLNRKKTLKQCGIRQDAVIVWNVMQLHPLKHVPLIDDEESNDMDEDVDIKQDEESMTVIVENEMNAATVWFEMKKHNSILDVKRMIEQRLSINRLDQILKFKEKVLEDSENGDCLANKGFTDGDTIYLNVNVCQIAIDIEVLGGDIIKNLRFVNDQSVLELKNEISNRCGLNSTDQILKYNDEEMDNSYCLYNYAISNGSLIKLTVRG
eukprot:79503_1